MILTWKVSNSCHQQKFLVCRDFDIQTILISENGKDDEHDEDDVDEEDDKNDNEDDTGAEDGEWWWRMKDGADDDNNNRSDDNDKKEGAEAIFVFSRIINQSGFPEWIKEDWYVMWR